MSDKIALHVLCKQEKSAEPNLKKESWRIVFRICKIRIWINALEHHGRPKSDSQHIALTRFLVHFQALATVKEEM